MYSSSFQERMIQLQGRETSEREQALEAQLVEARSIISEQVPVVFIILIVYLLIYLWLNGSVLASEGFLRSSW